MSVINTYYLNSLATKNHRSNEMEVSRRKSRFPSIAIDLQTQEGKLPDNLLYDKSIFHSEPLFWMAQYQWTYASKEHKGNENKKCSGMNTTCKHS